jgi:hypothetical protein
MRSNSKQSCQVRRAAHESHLNAISMRVMSATQPEHYSWGVMYTRGRLLIVSGANTDRKQNLPRAQYNLRNKFASHFHPKS